MKRRMSNLTKDKLKIIGFIIFVMAVIWVLTGAVLYVKSLFAEPINTEELNKAENEQQIYQEIRYLQMWQYTENMSQEEWEKTFLRG